MQIFYVYLSFAKSVCGFAVVDCGFAVDESEFAVGECEFCSGLKRNRSWGLRFC